MLRTILNRVTGSRGAGTHGTATTGGLGRSGAGATGGRRGQDEAIGRGVRGLLRRLRA